MADKRISQLNAHTSPTGSDLLVIVNNNETKKITYADLVVSLTGSETDLSALNTFTQSIDGRVDLLESWSSSLDSTFATDLQVSIVSSSVAATIGVISQNTGLLSTSSFNEYTASISTGSLVDRLDLIESVTSSYETKGSGILSGSVSYISLTDIPTGIVSQSIDIADFVFTTDTITNSDVTIVATDGDIVLNADGNVYVGSSNAGNGIVTNQYFDSVVGDINRINNGTGYSITDNLDNVINSIPSISSLNTFTSSQEVLNNTFATTGSNTFNGNQTINGSLNILTPSAGAPNSVSNWNGGGGWNQGFYSNLTTAGGTGTGLTVDVTTDGSGYIDINSITINTPGSGYTNGDVITIDNENNLPGTFTIGVEQGSGWVFNTSGSLVTPGDVNVSGSIYADNLDGLISSSAQITAFGFVSSSTDLSSLNAFTASYFTDSASIDSRLNGLEIFSSSLTDTFATDLEVSIVSSSVAATIGIISQNTGLVSTSSFNSFTQSIDSRVDNLENATGSYITSLNGTISGSSQLTSSFDERYTLSGSVQPLPNGLISGSSQLTSSYDTRYTLSGSVVSGTTPAGTISGSSQLTSSFDGRYTQTGSFNTLTQSFNSFTASAQSVTTGSNNFNGTQTITGSLNITNGSVIASQITANTASLYLTSGSNLYVQNNGVVEITGSLNVSATTTLKGAVTIGTGSGAEGGEISLAYAQSGSTSLIGSTIAFDVYSDKIRMFEGGGTNRGAYLNVASQSAGVGSEIVTSPNVSTIQTITSASYAALTPVSGTLYIIIG